MSVLWVLFLSIFQKWTFCRLKTFGLDKSNKRSDGWCPTLSSAPADLGVRIWTYAWSHLNFVDRVVHLLAPHRDAVLAVSVDPAILAETLRLEAGERPVVRNTHGALSRHGRESRRQRGTLGGPCGAQRHKDRPGTHVSRGGRFCPPLLCEYLPNSILPAGSFCRLRLMMDNACAWTRARAGRCNSCNPVPN